MKTTRPHKRQSAIPAGLRRIGIITFLAIAAVCSCPAQQQKDAPVKKPEALPENVEKFTVRTNSPLNKEAPFYLRVPKGYNPNLKNKAYRLLVLCPIYNGSGLKLIKNCVHWHQIADERQWFILTCEFRQDGKDARDRERSYYYPEGFSGKALLNALNQIEAKYPVDTNRLFLQGFSGGAHFVHRFAMWAPERVTAVIANTCSWFDKPDERSKRVAWLITVGESDPTYDQTLQVVDQLRRQGCAPLFRSYVGMLHETNGEVEKMLNTTFLKFYDDRTRNDLGKKRTGLTPEKELLSMSADEMPFIGDSQVWTYTDNTPETREITPEDTAIFLPSKELADIWGKREGNEE